MKAIIPVSNQGLLALTISNGNLLVGSGDGKLKLLKGDQVKWNIDTES